MNIKSDMWMKKIVSCIDIAAAHVHSVYISPCSVWDSIKTMPSDLSLLFDKSSQTEEVVVVVVVVEAAATVSTYKNNEVKLNKFHITYI